jgi:hypothetical protein
VAEGTHVGGSARHEIKAVSHAGEFDIRSTSGMETIDHVNKIVALFRPDGVIGKARIYYRGAEKSLGSKAPAVSRQN